MTSVKEETADTRASKSTLTYFTNMSGCPLTSQIRKVTGGMGVVSLASIDYRIFADNKAMIQSVNNSVTIALPRNCVPANGRRVTITHLRLGALPNIARAIVIPYSLHAIFGFHYTCLRELKYVVFEFGSEFQSITDSAFRCSGLRSLFFSAYCLFH
jgi:hypothetical protein